MYTFHPHPNVISHGLTRNQKFNFTVKPVLSGHSKIDKIKVLIANGSLMKVKIIGAFCNTFEHSAILLTCIKRYSFLKTNFWSIFEWPLKTDFAAYRYKRPLKYLVYA